MENQVITIPMEEYRELLIIKGKYEELKSQQTTTSYPLTRCSNQIIKDPDPPYKVTM